MSDNERPRPQFGEYATPEAQRNAIKVPLDDAEQIPVQSKESPSSHISVQGARPQGAGHNEFHPQDAGRLPRTRPSGADKFATVALLGIGLMTIFLTMPALLNLPAAIGPAFTQLGIGTFTTTDFALTLGWAALAAQVVLWVIALWLSLRNLRRAKLAWWIPLVFNVVANIVVFAVIAIAMTADPAFLEYVEQMSSPA